MQFQYSSVRKFQRRGQQAGTIAGVAARDSVPSPCTRCAAHSGAPRYSGACSQLRLHRRNRRWNASQHRSYRKLVNRAETWLVLPQSVHVICIGKVGCKRGYEGFGLVDSQRSPKSKSCSSHPAKHIHNCTWPLPGSQESWAAHPAARRWQVCAMRKALQRWNMRTSTGQKIAHALHAIARASYLCTGPCSPQRCGGNTCRR